MKEGLDGVELGCEKIGRFGCGGQWDLLQSSLVPGLYSSWAVHIWGGEKRK